MDYDWWMHSHENSRPKEEGDHVAFKGINQKGKRRQGTCLLLLLLYAFCFPLSSTSSKCSNHHVPPSPALLLVERGSYFNLYEDGFDDVQGYTSYALLV